MSTPQEVLEFWFGDEPTSPQELAALGARLGPGLDDEIRERFGSLVAEAIAGGLTQWEATEDGVLALILVLDQFPRHIYRGTAQQYDGDARALALASAAHEADWVDAMSPLRRTMALMPFAHVESLEVHRLNVARADAISAAMPPWYGPFATIGPSQSRKYLKVIEQFGRFPHRNGMLGRANTEDEQAWLDAGHAERMTPDILRERSGA